MTSPQPTVALNKIGQIAVTVHDIERAVSFYRDVLGMRFLFQAPPKLAFFDCGGVRVMLAEPESPEFDHPSSVLYFTVDDIQYAYHSLSERGVAFVDVPHIITPIGDRDLWMVFFRDPDKNLLALMSEMKRTV